MGGGRNPFVAKWFPQGQSEVGGRSVSWLTCAGALLLTCCASIGPDTIVRDRFDYVTTISDSSKRQMLLNLLKVRYADTPVFMDVASVISSYSVEGEINLSGQVAKPNRSDQFLGLETAGRYADQPTITYQPLAGDRFARSLLAPLPVTGILFLIQSGYPADLVLRVCVNRINGLENAYGGSGNPRDGNPEFLELMMALRESQAAAGAGFRSKEVKNTKTVVMYMPPSADTSSRTVRKLLGLNGRAREFNVVYGSFPENDTEVAILPRSILQVMIDFASYVDVPGADVTEGRVYLPQRSAEQERVFPPLFVVREGSSRPNDAYVAVRYRNHWFWIDDRDQQSKLMLSFLMLLFSLTEGTATQPAPVVTVPVR